MEITSKAKAEGTFIISNKVGLHARAAARFVSTASKFESDIMLEKNGYKVNGKSIMGIMTLAAPKGEKLVIKAVGIDAKEAITSLGKLINSKFGEE
ncbi:MAG: HPr family phosphocarrier protein [Thermodesulfobacteriota bacterium]